MGSLKEISLWKKIEKDFFSSAFSYITLIILALSRDFLRMKLLKLINLKNPFLFKTFHIALHWVPMLWP